jgi:hypothetical protein
VTAQIRLEEHYPGDEAWANFVASTPEGFERVADATALANALWGDRELAAVVYGHLGDQALAWVESPKEMLDGLSPAACLSDMALLRRLRTMLMRV